MTTPIFTKSKEAVIKKPRFVYYDKKGEAAQAVGNVARLFFNEKELQKMEMQGNIEVTYNGYILKSDEAVYLLKSNEYFYQPKPPSR